MVDENPNEDQIAEELNVNKHLMTRLGKGLAHAYKSTGATTLAQFCSAYGVGYSWMSGNIRKEFEPQWMRQLRSVKKASGLSWDDILGGTIRSTCREIEYGDTGAIVCSECGAVHDPDYTQYFCWCCGRKILRRGRV